MIRSIYSKYKSLIILYYKAINWFYLKIMKVKVKGKTKINGKLFLRNSGEVFFGNNLEINSGFSYNPIGGQCFTSIVVQKNAVLKICDNVGISNSAIYCKKKIIIGENVIIGGDCKIYDTDFHSVFLEDRLKEPQEGIKSLPVKINDGVFIGTGSIILKGVEIGENSVIAAGSVVSKNIPDNEIWGGNPIIFLKGINKKLK